MSAKTTSAAPRCKCIVTPPAIPLAVVGRVLHGSPIDSAGGRMAILIKAAGAPSTGWLSLVYTAMDKRWRLFNLSYVDRTFWHIAEGMVNYPVLLTPENIADIKSEGASIGLTPALLDSAINVAQRLTTIPLDIEGALKSKIKTLVEEKARAEKEALKPKPKTRTYTPRAKKVSVSSTEFKPQPPNAESYWYESENDARLLKDFVSLRLAGHVTNLMILGPSGFGKTQGIIRFGKVNNIPVHVVNCQAITTPEKWLGQMNATPERGTFFDVAPHLQWVERVHPDCEGAPHCIILYDEITRLRPELANMQFSLLDDQQGLEVPQMGRQVKMDPNNVVIATANFGTPYAGTFAMDWALRGRFDLQLERGMPPANEEIKVLETATGISDAQAASLVRVADNSRQLWQSGELESPISTRSLVAWARLIAGGYTIKEAAEYAIYPLYSEDGDSESDRAKVKMAVDGKVGSADDGGIKAAPRYDELGYDDGVADDDS